MKSLRIIGSILISGLAFAACGGTEEDAVEITDSEFVEDAALEVTNVDSSQVDEVVASMNGGDLTSAYQTALGGFSGFRFRDKEGKFEGDGCPEVTKSGTNPLTIERVFDDCNPGRRFSGKNAISLNGKTTIVITKNSGDDPDASPAAFNRDIQVTRDLTIGGLYRSDLKIDSNNSTSIVGNTGSSISISRSIDVTRERRNSKGEELRKYEIDGSRAIEISFSENEISEFKLVSGNSTIVHSHKGEVKRTIEVSSSNVVWNDSCCHPVSGSRDMTLTNAEGAVTTHSLVYSSTCGEAELDGEKIELNQCESI